MDLFAALRKGQYGRAFDMLHPKQRELLSRDAFVTCQTAATPLWSGEAVDSTYDDHLTAPGVATINTTAVTMNLASLRPWTGTFQFVHAEGEGWRWVVSTEWFDQLHDGECPFMWPRN